MSLDNAVAVSFFFLHELLHNYYDTMEELQQDVDGYVAFFNNMRLHQRLGMQTPSEAERNFAQKSILEFPTKKSSQKYPYRLKILRPFCLATEFSTVSAEKNKKQNFDGTKRTVQIQYAQHLNFYRITYLQKIRILSI